MNFLVYEIHDEIFHNNFNKKVVWLFYDQSPEPSMAKALFCYGCHKCQNNFQKKSTPMEKC